MNREKQYNCYFELTLDIIGGKWKPIILYYINTNKVARHSDLKRFIPSINERMLTRQLRELEEDELIKTDRRSKDLPTAFKERSRS